MQKIPFVLLAISLSVAGFASPIQEKTTVDRDVSLAVVTTDGRQVPANVQGLELKVVTITVKSDDSVKQLLAANHVYPDTEAFGLVYDLNPGLANVSLIKDGQQLTLPRIERRDSQPVLPSGQLVALTVDSGLKSQLEARFETLDNTTTTITRFGVERFTDAGERSSVIRSLRSINDSLAAIVSVTKGKILPIHNEVLKQVNDEVESLQLALDGIIQTQRKPTAEELDLIKLIDEDLTIKTRNLNDVRGPNEAAARGDLLVKVKVNAVGQDGKPVPNLRVYYVPMAIPKRIAEFNTLQFPAEHYMPIGNYVIWAGRPGQQAKEAAVSELKNLAVRKSSDSDLLVDLAIIN
jgi:hypothetical protein